MANNRDKDFGLLISIILPGYIAILGFADHSERIQLWIGQAGSESPSIGGFLLLTVASVFAGMTVSTIRWAVIDTLHHATGICRPNWQMSNLKDRDQAFLVMVDIHYRYYQFYANSIIAAPVLLAGHWLSNGFSILELIASLSLVTLFFFGSRDTLMKYYKRVDALLAT
jgi:hypothetical protein